MPDLSYILTLLGLSLALTSLALFLLYRRFQHKVIEHKATQVAVEIAKTDLQTLKNETDSTQTSLDQSKAELAIVEERTRELLRLEARAAEIQDVLDNGDQRRQELEQTIAEREADADGLTTQLHELQADLDLYTRIDTFVELGHYEEPQYMYEMADRYKEELKRCREQQRVLIKEGAIEVPVDIEVEGSSQKGKSILTGQSKMLLRAFNIECDLLIEKVTPSNFTRTLERIEKVAEALEKMALSLLCGFSTAYVKLKYEECKLLYEYKLKKAAEQEEQRLVREQIREEQQAIKEYERALADAEKEERMYEKLLEKARKELESAQEAERAEAETKIALLEEQLQEAQDKEERAKSMAEHTRRGHIYVISNVGSFGEDVYKIGLTRRLDPMDRVKELGDASVPFTFDVHAVIYSDDAPALEAALHRRFDRGRVNAVNKRKEFFRVDLTTIKEAVEELSGAEAEFRMTATAEEYYESMRLLDEVVADK